MRCFAIRLRAVLAAATLDAVAAFTAFTAFAAFAAVAVAGVAVVAVGGCGGDTTPGAASDVPPVADARAVQLTTLAGATVSPLDNADRPVVFLFVRTDCPISNRYAPEVRRIHAAFSDRVRFWLVYADPDQSVAEIRAHLEAYAYPIDALRDPGHELVRASGATVTPEAAVYTAGGELVYRGRIDDLYVQLGEARRVATTHELRDALAAVLAGRPVAVPRAPAVGCYITDLGPASSRRNVRTRPEPPS